MCADPQRLKPCRLDVLRKGMETHRLDVIINQSANQQLHSPDIIINPIKQHTLVPNRHRILKQPQRRPFRNPRDLTRMIKMRMKRHTLSSLPPQITDPNQRLRPFIRAVQGPRRTNQHPLLAKRIRRTLSISRSCSPIAHSCGGSREKESPPDTTKSLTEEVWAM